jgi:hypothetical protein
MISTAHVYYWSEEMKKLAIAFVVGSAALLGGSAANAGGQHGEGESRNRCNAAVY